MRSKFQGCTAVIYINNAFGDRFYILDHIRLFSGNLVAMEFCVGMTDVTFVKHCGHAVMWLSRASCDLGQPPRLDLSRPQSWKTWWPEHMSPEFVLGSQFVWKHTIYWMVFVFPKSATMLEWCFFIIFYHCCRLDSKGFGEHRFSSPCSQSLVWTQSPRRSTRSFGSLCRSFWSLRNLYLSWDAFVRAPLSCELWGNAGTTKSN